MTLIKIVKNHTSKDSHIDVTRSARSLLKAAEEVHLPKSLRQEFGGGFKEFVGSEANCFEGSDDEIRFFTTQERQSLVMHLLHTLRAGPHDLHSLPGLKMVEGQAIIPKCISSGIISQVRYMRILILLCPVRTFFDEMRFLESRIPFRRREDL